MILGHGATGFVMVLAFSGELTQRRSEPAVFAVVAAGHPSALIVLRAETPEPGHQVAKLLIRHDVRLCPVQFKCSGHSSRINFFKATG